MVEPLYELLNWVGFTHPVHPAITHLPMGMVMGAFLFSLGSLKYAELASTAHHCAVLALIFVLPTIIAGVLDWQHFYDGDFTGPIIAKLVLATVLTLLLIAAVRAGGSESKDSRVCIVLYTLCLLAAVGLGFSGGEIQYG
jgi:uncharacterized membrane protein